MENFKLEIFQQNLEFTSVCIMNSINGLKIPKIQFKFIWDKNIAFVAFPGSTWNNKGTQKGFLNIFLRYARDAGK